LKKRKSQEKAREEKLAEIEKRKKVSYKFFEKHRVALQDFNDA